MYILMLYILCFCDMRFLHSLKLADWNGQQKKCDWQELVTNRSKLNELWLTDWNEQN